MTLFCISGNRNANQAHIQCEISASRHFLCCCWKNAFESEYLCVWFPLLFLRQRETLVKEKSREKKKKIVNKNQTTTKRQHSNEAHNKWLNQCLLELCIRIQFWIVCYSDTQLLFTFIHLKITIRLSAHVYFVSWFWFRFENSVCNWKKCISCGVMKFQVRFTWFPVRYYLVSKDFGIFIARDQAITSIWNENKP